MKKNLNNEKKSPDIPEERYDLKILQALRRIIRAVDIHSRSLNLEHNITAPQLITLLAVAEKGPLTLAAIAKEVHLSPSTLVGIIDRLEQKNYVRRDRSDRDRRRVHVSLTQQGRKFAESAPSPLQEKFADALSELSIEEQATISRSLQRVVELMEAKELDAAPILQTGRLNSPKKS